MNTTILVLAAILAFGAILTYIAFRRGWFCLAPVPTETKGHFVLMVKKDKIQEDEKKALQ